MEPEPGTGDRGVSEVIGFILVFSFLVGAFTIYQGLVVPEQNRQVEVEHNKDVQGQIQDPRNAIVSTAATGTGQSVSVEMGAAYPTRAIARNLGISAGSIRTVAPAGGGIRLENARAVDPETRDYLSGDPRTFESRSIRYAPIYSFYSTAPDTVYENTLVYNRFDEANLTLTDQVMVEGRRITLIAVNGSLASARQGTVSVSTEAISASSNRVAVTNTTGERVTLTVPTRLDESQWEEVLADEMSPAGYVDDVEAVPGADAVTIVLRPGVTYDLRLAEVGVGESTVEEGPKYVTDIEGNDVSVPEKATRKLVVEVRDRFNNPVSNVTVDASITTSAGTGDAVSPSSQTTDSDGRASYTYLAPAEVDGAQDADIEVSFDGDGTANQSVTFDVTVLDSDGSGGGSGNTGGSINPASAGSLVLDSALISEGAGCGGNCVNVTVENLDASDDQEVTDVRLIFYSTGGGTAPPQSARVDGTLVQNGGDYESVSLLVTAGNKRSFSIDFFSDGSGSSAFNPSPGDFFLVAVLIDNGQDSATYFVAPR